MNNIGNKVEELLNQYSYILRKYQLNNKDEYIYSFKNIELEILEKSWNYSFEKIKNRDIIKNTQTLPENGKRIVNKKFEELNKDIDSLYKYLKKEFDVKELKYDEERIERKLRNKLALIHQKKIKNKINNLIRQQKIYETKRKIKSIAIISIFPILIFSFLFGEIIIDGFTSVDTLTERIYNREVYKFNGSKCRDGSLSHSQGRGTCSWHGGVRFKFYKGQHKKSMEECEKIAKKKSWID
ncbi:DUF3761 domain-containing protein [Tenacibaculum finnmarkense]|uniref:DUF3761 domain-containing protein n=1 Tax=Tenacibaculum finnmarkense TaxID=2781243 RepID=UPI001EFB33E3|nr:DUF3761 domain-containing protein [Tenacibaculum finnmarkense]MCG8796685.1 hypothetical protein [Tenacibaculum finnmarkense]MCG8798963.1 hypothetical protein [Tenacibaculum finnmarkense]